MRRIAVVLAGVLACGGDDAPPTPSMEEDAGRDAELPEPRCGDGRLAAGESCDDGNDEDGDGCSGQ